MRTANAELLMRRAAMARARYEEYVIRELLGRWVSELEPAVAYRDGEIVGLTIAAAPIGSAPFIMPID